MTRGENSPILPNIRQVVGNHGPYLLLDPLLALAAPLLDQVLAVLDHGDRAQRRAVPLRPAPVAVVPRPVGVELGLAQPGPGRLQAARGVRHRLQDGLRADVVIDMHPQRRIAKQELVDEGLEGQGGVARPGVKVLMPKLVSSWACNDIREMLTIGVHGRGTGDDEAGAGPRDARAIGADVGEDSLEGNLGFCFGAVARVSTVL